MLQTDIRFSGLKDQSWFVLKKNIIIDTKFDFNDGLIRYKQS